jgi:heat shock protein HslJ
MGFFVIYLYTNLEQELTMTKYVLPLIAFIVLLVLSGCGLFPGNPRNDLNGTSWTLESYGGESLLANSTMTAIFESGEVSGSASCNHYFGAYKIKGNQLTVEGLGWTEMACMDPEGIMEQEQIIMALLGNSASYQIEGNKLILQTADGEKLIFVPLD